MSILKEFKELTNENENFKSNIIIRCPFKSCNTRIISLTEELAKKTISVENSPLMVKISQDTSNNEFYKINDVWDFDNIGVSKPSDSIQEPTIKENGEKLNFKIERLLICSECDKGPLGFAGFQGEETDVKKLKYFLSCNSVLYEEK